MAITKQLTITLTPQELATAFCQMGDDEQAAFFSAIKPITDEWPGAGWCSQCNWIISSLDDAGLAVVTTLASHLPATTLLNLAEQAA